ncbi:MAG: hypothetical protein JO317_00165 [Verrucomicrobiae bacterium]|nr:hypothetical protein [Verrucomicrobiae bacterium]
MATVVNNPGNGDTGSGMGFIVGILVVVILGIVFFVYGLPALKNNTSSAPTTTEHKIDVNVGGGSGSSSGSGSGSSSGSSSSSSNP